MLNGIDPYGKEYPERMFCGFINAVITKISCHKKISVLLYAESVF